LWGNDTLVDGHNRFDETHDTGTSFEMANVWFDTPDDTGRFLAPAGTLKV
jgi:hypothetical protein